MQLIFATHNEDKVKEIRAIVEEGWDIISLDEIGLTHDIPEPFNTLEKNAWQKSNTVFEETGKDCFSEDTGLEVKTLDGAPGVLSARFAGPQKNAADNINLLLHRMKEEENREARFRTIISFMYKGKEKQFEGICEGNITKNLKGEDGFGYDPVFIPVGADRTFAEMAMEEKSTFSHRTKAFKKFISFLKELS